MQQLLTSAAGVFLGSLPLLGVIGWASFPQNSRLSRIESQLDELGKDLKALGIRVSSSETEMAIIKTKLDRPVISPAR